MFRCFETRCPMLSINYTMDFNTTPPCTPFTVLKEPLRRTSKEKLSPEALLFLESTEYEWSVPEPSDRSLIALLPYWCGAQRALFITTGHPNIANQVAAWLTREDYSPFLKYGLVASDNEFRAHVHVPTMAFTMNKFEQFVSACHSRFAVSAVILCVRTIKDLCAMDDIVASDLFDCVVFYDTCGRFTNHTIDTWMQNVLHQYIVRG